MDLFRFLILMPVGLLMVFASGCVSNYDNTPMKASRYMAVDAVDPVGTRNIEANDIANMTSQIMRDMLLSPILNRTPPVVVIIDDQYFMNDSSQRNLNKNMIVTRLRNELVRAANGKIRFVARHASGMFEEEQALRQKGAVGGVVCQNSSAAYRLTGRIMNQEDRMRGGRVSNYVQISFEMVSLNTSELVWSGLYELRKQNQEDVMYR